MPVQTILGGADVTAYVQEGSVSEKLNSPAHAAVKAPAHLVSAGIGSSLDVLVDGAHRFHGPVEYIEHHGLEDRRDSTFTAVDPTFMWNWRVAQDADGDYTKPTFIEDFVTGPAIMQAIIQHSVAQFGPIGHSIGSVASGGADLTGAPTNWPKTIAEVFTLLTETGELDGVYSPSSNSVSFYNGDYGSDLSGSVNFTYGSGGNCRACRVTEDGKEMVNRMRYLLGPRVGTSEDPAGDQHWRGSIDRTTMTVPFISQINSAASGSEAQYLTRFLVRIFDARGDEAIVGRELYLNHFARELWMRLKPKLMFHITPHRGIAPAFGIGDLISVAGFGLSGVQRVMEMTYRWTADGPIELGEPVGQAGAAAVSTTGILEGLGS